MHTLLKTAVPTTGTQMEEVSRVTQYLQSHIPTLINFGVKVVIAILVFLIGQKLIRLFRKLLKASLQKTSIDHGVISFLDSGIKMVLYGLLLFSIASKFGLDTATVAALLASAGVAIGLALQGSLSNLAGGLLILILKPFKVGDYIFEHTQGHNGTVKEIQIFYTKLLTPDNRTVVIPNGTLSNGCITNCSQQNERRVDFQVGISYKADLAKAKAIILDLMKQDPDVLEHEGNVVFVSDLADSCVKLEFRVWCRSEHYWDLKFRLLEQVKLEFDRQGIEIPYPQLVIHRE